MRRRFGWTALLGCCGAALAVGLPAAAPGAAPAAASELQIGLVKGLFRDVPRGIVEILALPFRELVSSRTGLTGKVDPTLDAETLARQLTERRTHLGVFQGFEFAWVRDKHPQLEPLAIAVRTPRQLHGLLVARADAPIRGFADLKGKAVSIPSGTRDHARLFLQRGCADIQLDLTKSAKVIESASPGAGLDAVAAGKADAVVIDNGVLDSYARLAPDWQARLKVVGRSVSFPPTVIVYERGALPAQTIESIRETMTQAHTTQQGRDLMRLWRMKSFEPVPADYAAQLAAIRKAYPPPPAN
jgi:ABC-type phosphate/phosphonate transport system substrate-binding protein